MARKHHKPEEIVLKLRHVDVLVGREWLVQMRSGKLVSPSKRITVGVSSTVAWELVNSKS